MKNRELMQTLLLGVIGCLLAACWNGAEWGPEYPGSSISLAIISGNEQTAEVGTELPQRVVLRVTDQRGRPLRRRVEFEVTSGGGRIVPELVVSDVQGYARARWTLGTAAGAQAVVARVRGYDGSAIGQVDCIATARSGKPSQVRIVAGDAQYGVVSAQLLSDVVVAVADRFGNPTAGIQVAFAALLGGTASPATAFTDPEGHASTSWTLGPAAGSQMMNVVVQDLPTLTVTATAAQAQGDTLAIASGDGQIGVVVSELMDDLVVQVRGPDGNVISGRTVSFRVLTGGGTVYPESATSDEHGFARCRWRLGADTGTQQLEASLETIASVRFHATAVASFPSRFLGIDGDLQMAPTGRELSRPVTVTLVDDYETPIRGWPVHFVSQAGSVSAETVVTDDEGRASVRWTMGSATGLQVLEVNFSVGQSVGQVVKVHAIAYDETTPATMVVVSGNNQTGPVNATLPQDIVVCLFDASGPVADAVLDADQFIVGSDGAEPVQSGPDGCAGLRWYLGSTLGPQQLSLTADVGSAIVGATVDAVAGPDGSFSLRAVSGDQQVGAPEQPLAQPLVVRVTRQPFLGAEELPVPGALVRFNPITGGTSVPVSAVTDEAGLASTSWTLGPNEGSQRLEATLGESCISDRFCASFSARAFQDPDRRVTSVVMVSGEGQTGPAGSTLAEPVIVELQNGFGAPVPNYPVEFRVASEAGNGTVNPTATQTDSSGRASATWTLGTRSGPQELFVVVLPSPYEGGFIPRFSATATPDLPVAAISIVSGDMQTVTAGTALSEPVVVRVTQTAGAPVWGQLVGLTTVQGNGITSSAATTDSEGYATIVWSVGTDAGDHIGKLRAGEVEAEIHATVLPAAPARIAVFDGDVQRGWPGAPLATPITAIVLDRFQNAVPVGVPITFSPLNGGSAAPGIATSDGLGVASSVWTLGPETGIMPTLELSSPGLPTTAITASLNVAPSSPVTLLKENGDGQSLPAPHMRLAAPLQVVVMDLSGLPVPGVTVTFSPASGSAYLWPEQVDTDQNGRATWQGYIHGAGLQQLDTSVANATPVRFEVRVSGPDAHAFDGSYDCRYAARGAAPADTQPVVIANGVVLPSGPVLPHQILLSSAFSEGDGTLTYVARDGLNFSVYFVGQLMLDAAGRATGQGRWERLRRPQLGAGVGLPALCRRR